MLLRLFLVMFFGIAIVGPAPLHGVRELAQLAAERVSQWKAFSETVQVTYRTFRDAAQRVASRAQRSSRHRS